MINQLHEANVSGSGNVRDILYRPFKSKLSLLEVKHNTGFPKEKKACVRFIKKKKMEHSVFMLRNVTWVSALL